MERTAFADRLRAAITAREVTLASLHERLAARGNTVSIATLSSWRSGSRHPEGAASRAAIADLEELLGLEPGALTDLIGPARRTGPVAAPLVPPSAAEVAGAAEETFARLAAGNLSNLRSLIIHIAVDVDQRGEQRRVTERRVLQAVSGRVTAIPHLVVAGTVQFRPLRFRALSGCRLTHTYAHPGGRVFGAAFDLDRSIVTGETAVVDFAVDVPAGFAEKNEFVMTLVRPLREFLLWMRFDPARTPVWYEKFAVVDGKESSRRVTAAELDQPITSIHVMENGFGPGTIGLRWGFAAQRRTASVDPRGRPG
ncbi:hypothetical protein [Microlunatus sp. GCM10028923]|uniref:hypothetical protein n=1 Tax=Microlunatus sp. GCM10028923 TaxID=3273400 RepID=UPI003621C958